MSFCGLFAPRFCFVFLYNCTAFENYVSCNDLILLIVIQKKLSFPPSNYPGGIDGPEKRPIQCGLYPGGNKKQKEGEKKTTRNRLRGVWPVSLRSGVLAVAWGDERQGACSMQHGSRETSQPHRPQPARPSPSLGVMEVLQQRSPPLLCYVHLVL